MKKLIVILILFTTLVVSCEPISKARKLDGKCVKDADGNFYRISHGIGVLVELQEIDTTEINKLSKKP